MICPYCGVGINLPIKNSCVFLCKTEYEEPQQIGYEVFGGFCPECNQLILQLRKGGYNYNDDFDSSGWHLECEHSVETIFPKFKHKQLPQEISERYRNDFLEAYTILEMSPKASAAISRRILQDILRNEYNIKKYNLEQEIEEFIALSRATTNLLESIDAIRVIGNFAAHPIKSTNTGLIVDVEDGEAEWVLDVLELLFDFTFVQPQKYKQMRDNYNSKLREVGKPELKPLG